MADAATYNGISKADKEDLLKAVKLYAATGKDLSGVVNKIPLEPQDPEERKKRDEERAAAKAEKDEASLKLQAEAQRGMEEAAQKARKIAMHTDDAGNVSLSDEEKEELVGAGAGARQPGNPGAGQPAPATERAKAQGRGRPEVTAPPTRSR